MRRARCCCFRSLRIRLLVLYLGAVGADTGCFMACELLGLVPGRFKLFKPNFERDGRPGAYFVRNSAIVKAADAVIAVWDGESRGTVDTIKKTEGSCKALFIYEFKKETFKRMKKRLLSWFEHELREGAKVAF